MRLLHLNPVDGTLADLLRQRGAQVDLQPQPPPRPSIWQSEVRSPDVTPRTTLQELAGQFDGLFCHGGINSSKFSGQEAAHHRYLEAILATTRKDGLFWISPHNKPENGAEESSAAATKTQINFFKERGFVVHQIKENQTFALDLTQDFGVSNCYPRLIYTKNLSPHWCHEDYNNETYFPKTLLKEMAEILWAKRGRFAVYRDFPVLLTDPSRDDSSYDEEWLRFKTRAERLPRVVQWLHRKIRGVQPSFPPVVLLQHDADHTPYKTVDLMEYERSLGIRSSAYFFYKQNLSDRWEPYTLDIHRLQSLEKIGFEIGYHLNAYELADYDLDKAFDLIRQDLDFLQKHFQITSFVPHGGIPGPDGINNQMIPYSGVLRQYQWPYHLRGLKHDYYWSDGSIGSESLQDPREMIRKLEHDQRMMFLMHPQYYGDELAPDYEKLPIAKERWWRELWGL